MSEKKKPLTAEEKLAIAEAKIAELQAAPKEDATPKVAPIKCEVVIAINEDNVMSFSASGRDANLVHISGLIEYAKLRVAQLWTPQPAADEEEGK